MIPCTETNLEMKKLYFEATETQQESGIAIAYSILKQTDYEAQKEEEEEIEREEAEEGGYETDDSIHDNDGDGEEDFF